ncbi:MAG: ferritin-like domain-containing protein [Methanomassiliicoccus sp.]|nr:ferritin-like domain-containing protein [Methanomassiliicoccus sp.]
MLSEKLLGMLNEAVSMELQASIQYMWQHVQWGGVKHFAVSDQLEDIAIQEMKHAEKIAERLWYFGVKPTTKPSPITVGEDLWQMVDLDTQAELSAIRLYKDIIRQAAEEGDVTTKFIFEGILEEEEEHHDFFISVAEDKEKQ